MDIKHPTIACICCYTALWNINRCGGVVNNQIKKGLLLSVSVKFFKSVNIWQSYKQERGCLVYFARLANTLLKDEESARDDHVFACNFDKYSPIFPTKR